MKKLLYVSLLLILISSILIFRCKRVEILTLANVDEITIKREIWNSVNGLGNARKLKAYVGLINTDNVINIVASFETESGRSLFEKIMSNQFITDKDVNEVLRYLNDTLCRAFEIEGMYVADYKTLIDEHIEFETNKKGKRNSKDIDEDVVILNRRYDSFKSNIIEYQPNGMIDEDFNQGKVGDCWLIAALNSLRLTETGNKMLNDIVSMDSVGNVRVILKSVDKEYVMTPEELAGADELVRGDLDVRAIEIAVIRFLHEIQDHQTHDKSIQNKMSGVKIKSADINDGMSPLSAPFYLLFDEECIDNIAVDEDLIEKIKSRKYIVLVSSHNGYSLDSFSKHHVYSVVSADDDFVYMYDPYDIDNLRKMSDKDFMSFFNHAYSYEIQN